MHHNDPFAWTIFDLLSISFCLSIQQCHLASEILAQVPIVSRCPGVPNEVTLMYVSALTKIIVIRKGKRDDCACDWYSMC